jgi:hypothetical protein
VVTAKIVFDEPGAAKLAGLFESLSTGLMVISTSGDDHQPQLKKVKTYGQSKTQVGFAARLRRAD